MLQRWRKPHTVVISPDEESIKGSSNSVDSIQLTNQWSDAVDKLEITAAQLTGKRIRVIISNHYVRYALLPWHEDIYSRRDWQSLAERHMKSIYGNNIERWKVTIAFQGYGLPVILCAVDQAMLDRVTDIANLYQWKIENITPALLTVLNQYRAKLKQDDHLLMVERDRLVLAEISNNSVTHFNIIAPNMKDIKNECVKLIKRTIKPASHGKANVSVFGQTSLISELSINNVTVSDLSIDKSVSMSELLADLS